MTDVFISHAEADEPVANEIARGLEAAGYTTWLYKTNGIPGASYLEQTGDAVESARAFLLLISARSLGSKQVDSEVVRAHECGKPFFPVLLGLSHAEFQQRHPAWRQAVGSATSIQIPAAGTALILPRLLLGLKTLGDERDSLPPTQRPAHDAPPVRPSDRTRRGSIRLASWPVIGLLLVVSIVAAGMWIVRLRAGSPVTPVETPLTSLPPESPVLSAAISPDGEHLAYADSSGYYLLDIETQRVSPLPAEGLPRSPGGLWPGVQIAWFPDGESLVIGTSILTQGCMRDSLWTVSLLERRVRRIRDGASEPAVSPTGAIAFVARSESGNAIWLMDADGSGSRRVTPATGERHGFQFPAWSPSGERLAYLTSRGDPDSGTYRPVIETCDLDGREITHIRGDSWLGAGFSAARGLCWLRDGRLLFYQPDSTQSQDIVHLWAVPVDTRTGALRGRPSRVLGSAGHFISDLTCSADGRRLGFVRWRTQADVYLAELEDTGRRLGAIRRLTLDQHVDLVTGWTPDSRAVMFLSTRNDPTNLYRQGIDERVAVPLLDQPASTERAALTADGAWIIYMLNGPDVDPRGTTGSFMRVAASGGPAQSIAEPDTGVLDLMCGSRPGAPCILAVQVGSERVFFEFDPLTGARKELTRISMNPQPSIMMSVSPDGRQVVLDDGAHPVLVDLETGARTSLQYEGREVDHFLGWAADGGIWFGTGGPEGTMLVHGDSSGRTRPAGIIDTDGGLFASPDGRFLAFDRWTYEANAWMIEGF
ncbi:MAG: TIR domain-containing protein [Candidatus Latescibacteria bacterium]|nr:TIR domain-containing protein [Candidatus Latescibacterota bacterium]